jgi:hypothetical protein
MLIKTKWRKTGWIVCALIPLLVVVACGKKQGSTASEQAAKEQAATEKAATTTRGVESSDPVRNYKVAYLTVEKMEKFIESLKEEVNPFDVLFKGGQMRSSSAIKDEVERFNAFAQKYGFKGYEDYTAVWGRITVGEMAIGAEEMTKGLKESMEKMAADAEKSLKDPNLSPEMKKVYEDQVASSKKSAEDLSKPQDSSLNEDDLNLIRKYKAQIDEATKKYKTKTGGND